MSSSASDLIGLLSGVVSGSLEATVDGAPFVVLDGDHRSLTVELGVLAGGPRKPREILREHHIRLWELRGIPSALARSGWQVSLRDGPRELVRLGRDASALTGHIHVSPAAFGKLRRLL